MGPPDREEIQGSVRNPNVATRADLGEVTGDRRQTVGIAGIGYLADGFGVVLAPINSIAIVDRRTPWSDRAGCGGIECCCDRAARPSNGSPGTEPGRSGTGRSRWTVRTRGRPSGGFRGRTPGQWGAARTVATLTVT
jgi:hypothetical protein